MAAALLIATSVATPVLAQQADTASPPASGGFSLENIGRPTREAPRPQAQGPVDPDAPIATRPASRPSQSQTQSGNIPSSRTPPAPTITLSPPVASRPSGQDAAPPRRQAPSPATTQRSAPPATRLSDRDAAPSQPPEQAGALAQSPAAASSALPTIRDPLADAPIVRRDGETGGLPWAWVIAALALLGGLFYYLRNRNSVRQPAVGVPLSDAKPTTDNHERDAPRDAATPDAPAIAPPARPAAALAAPPVEAAAPAAQSGEGIEVTFVPDYAAATFTRVAMRYLVTVRNGGSERIGDLAIRAAMIPASAQQDQELAAFMADTMRAVSHHVETLEAGQSVDIEGEMALPLNQTRPVRYGERLLFVPVAAFALSFTRNQRACHVPLAYMVGVDSAGAQGKMGPLRLDLGPKTYNQVGQRPLALASAA